jgi:hypothetical protein
MEKFFNPYIFYRKKLWSKLNLASKKSDPALWLYQNDARTDLFMLQSIARLMWKYKPDKENGKLRLRFKELEDMLGRVDQYDTLAKEAKKMKLKSKAAILYYEKKREKALWGMNELLLKKKFLKKFMVKFGASLKTNFNDTKLINGLAEEIRSEMLECESFFQENPEAFDDMESQVHEFRRKLRWVSIYAMSLQGMIVLKTAAKKVWEKEFIDEATRKSPFNVLPKAQKLKSHIPYNKNAFLAVSFVIKELGIIKDEGLAAEALIKALRKGEGMGKKTAHHEAYRLLNRKDNKKELLAKAHRLLQVFFVKYKIHLELV